MTLSRSGAAWASGKLILVGEHAVVYGHPAIAFSVSLGTEVTVTPHDGPLTISPSAGIDPHDPRLFRAISAAAGPTGARVVMRSDLPVGRGMGSSAALAVALHRALADADGAPISDEALFDRAMAVERVFHGNPSGLDVAISVRGGICEYRRTPTGPELHPLGCPGWQVVVLDTGRAGDTAELVAGVAARRPDVDPLLTRIGALVHAARDHLNDPHVLGELLNENHALLQAIGVSDDGVDALVTLARAHGARGAKLSGAGGGGVVIALVDDAAPLLHAASQHGIPACTARPTPSPGSR